MPQIKDEVRNAAPIKVGRAAEKLPTRGKLPAPPVLRKIDLEEHFGHPAAMIKTGSGEVDLTVQARTLALEPDWFKIVWERLSDFDRIRIPDMDATATELTILSPTSPAVQGMTDPDQATSAAREINDFLADIVAKHPTRFAGFATVALQNPESAARELERCVQRLGFKGAMINGYSNSGDRSTRQYLDEPRCLPFWEAVAALDVPVYLHPRTAPDDRVYEGHKQLAGSMWGFGPETAAHALRLVHSGLFDRYPNLTVILGHLGEMLPFFTWRIQHCFEYNPFDKHPQRRLQDYLCENFYFTTSGTFSDQALICALLTVGADRILFSSDYPYEVREEATRWIEETAISENDRRKIAYGNSQKLFKL